MIELYTHGMKEFVLDVNRTRGWSNFCSHPELEISTDGITPYRCAICGESAREIDLIIKNRNVNDKPIGDFYE